MSEIHSEQNEESEYRTITSFSNSDKTIRLKNVCFKYDKARANYTLKNINLTIPQGKVTAIVGESGSGKTTLIKLLLGYYQTDNGEIRVGSENLDKFNESLGSAASLNLNLFRKDVCFRQYHSALFSHNKAFPLSVR